MIDYLGYGIGGVVVLYILVRIGSAAYFKSKDEYERKRQHHG